MSKTFTAGVFCAAILTGAIWVGCVPAVGQSRKAPAKPKTPVAPVKRPPPDAIVPFKEGEHLSFRVLWSKYNVNAGAITFFVVERRNFFGHNGWHFRASAQSVQTMRMVYPLDDQFDSYSDTLQLSSLQYEMYLHEQGKQETNVWRMFPDPAGAGPGVILEHQPVGTRDPLGMLYALRAADWKKEPEFRTTVFDGHQLYDLVARLVQATGQIAVPAGQFEASKIDVGATPHGQTTNTAGTHFSLWVAHDTAHTPVLIEADLPVGSARVELTARQ